MSFDTPQTQLGKALIANIFSYFFFVSARNWGKIIFETELLSYLLSIVMHLRFPETLNQFLCYKRLSPYSFVLDF